jgi:hypothetical protein
MEAQSTDRAAADVVLIRALGWATNPVANV